MENGFWQRKTSRNTQVKATKKTNNTHYLLFVVALVQLNSLWFVLKRSTGSKRAAQGYRGINLSRHEFWRLLFLRPLGWRPFLLGWRHLSFFSWRLLESILAVLEPGNAKGHQNILASQLHAKMNPSSLEQSECVETLCPFFDFDSHLITCLPHSPLVRCSILSLFKQLLS